MAVNFKRHRMVDAWQGLLRALLPPRCLLCGGTGHDGIDLCAACRVDLIRNTSFCARCAVPMPTPSDLCGACQKHLPPWTAAWAPFTYAWPLDRLETRFKYSSNLACGRVLSHLWSQCPAPPPLPAWIVPVPLHASRLRQRGYNQTMELARPLARTLRVPLVSDALIRSRDTSAQTTLDAKARKRNVRGAFVVNNEMDWPDHVVVLDDVMTTGATLAECSRVLLKAGVVRIDVWALARAPTPHN